MLFGLKVSHAGVLSGHDAQLAIATLRFGMAEISSFLCLVAPIASKEEEREDQRSRVAGGAEEETG